MRDTSLTIYYYTTAVIEHESLLVASSARAEQPSIRFTTVLLIHMSIARHSFKYNNAFVCLFAYLCTKKSLTVRNTIQRALLGREGPTRMHIQIRYFASLREITGEGEEQLVVPDGATITDVRTMLLARYSQLRLILERCVYAVNRHYVPAETILKEGDELVFIPPTGGGTPIVPLIQLTREPLNRDALVTAVSHPSVGGIVVFEG